MKDEGVQEFWTDTERFEGKVYCLYLDVLGLVTTAIGNLCHDVHVAMSMPFYRPDGTRATPDDIRAEHARVRAMFCGVKGAEPEVQCGWRGTSGICLAHRGWKAAFASTSLRLHDDGVKGIVLAKMGQHDAILRGRFVGFDSWPWQAQLAVHSLAWACGAHFRYPAMAKHLNAGNFAEWHIDDKGATVITGGAAFECTIKEAGNPGVKPRNVRNRELLLEAASSVPVKPAHSGVLGPAAIGTFEKPTP